MDSFPRKDTGCGTAIAPMTVDRILIPAETLRERIAELSRQIDAESTGMDLVLVGVLRGAFIFLSDLLRGLDCPAAVDFVAAASYGAAMRPGDVRITHDLRSPVADRDVIVVEDIVDSGQTLQALYRHIGAHRPRSLRACTLLSKPSRRVVAVDADWTGFDIPDEFVVGYGLDYAEQFRGLPYIATLRPQRASR